MQNNSLPPAKANTTVSVQMGRQVQLCCPFSPQMILITWEIILKNQSSCKMSYHVAEKEINGTNCTDIRITWPSTSDQSSELQIDAVDTAHDGHYICEIAAAPGNFLHRYDLQVLVTPKVALTVKKNRTAICEAIAGKPAAQISWSPEGECVTDSESYGNDTVTVRSTCLWRQKDVSAVRCFVSHVTGDKTVTQGLSPGGQTLELYVLYIITPILFLIIVGSIWFLKVSGFRKCKLKKSETTTVVEEDEMQPYASYTEKSNPLYDTVSKEDRPRVSQSEADGTGLQTLSAVGIQCQEK